MKALEDKFGVVAAAPVAVGAAPAAAGGDEGEEELEAILLMLVLKLPEIKRYKF